MLGIDAPRIAPSTQRAFTLAQATAEPLPPTCPVATREGVIAILAETNAYVAEQRAAASSRWLTDPRGWASNHNASLAETMAARLRTAMDSGGGDCLLGAAVMKFRTEAPRELVDRLGE